MSIVQRVVGESPGIISRTGSIINLVAPSFCNPMLSCDTVSAVAYACGFAPYGGSPCYSAYTTTCGQPDDITYSNEVDCDSKWFYQTDVQVGCTGSLVNSCCNASGSLTTVEIKYQSDSCPNVTIVDSQTGNLIAEPDPPDCDCSLTLENCLCTEGDLNVCNNDCAECPGEPISNTTSACFTQDVTLSQEITDDSLCEIAATRLAAYPDTWDGDCSASRDLDAVSSVHSCAIQRFKYKFTFPEVPNNGLKLCWNEHFVPDVGDPVDTPRTFTFDGVQTETSELEVTEPGEDGEITITDVSCNCP